MTECPYNGQLAYPSKKCSHLIKSNKQYILPRMLTRCHCCNDPLRDM